MAIIITNWSTSASDPSPYLAPELRRICLQGNVYGHPRFKNGSSITTSSVREAKDRMVKTRNTVYVLGKIDPDFRKFLKKERPNWDWRNPITFI